MATKQVKVCDLCGFQEDLELPESHREIGKLILEFAETGHGPVPPRTEDICFKCATTLINVIEKMRTPHKKS